MSRETVTPIGRDAAAVLDEHTAASVAELFRALGDASRVRIVAALLDGEQNVGSLAAGQVFLLCSDGVTDVLDDQAIVLILQLPQSLEARCMQLVSTAVGLGGQDNTTAVLVEVLAAPRVAVPREPDIFWDHDPATEGLGARTLRPIELVEVELNSGRLPPEITQVISIEEVERELKARTPKGGFLSRLLRR